MGIFSWFTHVCLEVSTEIIFDVAAKSSNLDQK